MIGITIPAHTLIALFCAAFSLFPSSLPISRSIPHMTLNKSMRLQNFSPLATSALIVLLPQNANAIAIPEVAHPLPYTAHDPNNGEDKGPGRRNWSSESLDCTDTTVTEASIPTGTLAGYSGVEPVTVTVTVGLPNSTYMPSGYVSGAPGITETAVYGSTSPSTGTSTSSAPISTVNPIFASAEEAQRLNLAFQSLKTSDACTAGQRACIAGQIAQCSVPSSSSETPRWVTQACVISSDPNQVPVCAAIPDFTANSTSTTPGSTNTTSTSSPVVLGCFNPTNITQAFDTAGVQGGLLPPGTQASAALRLLAGKGVGGFGLGALLALTVMVLL